MEESVRSLQKVLEHIATERALSIAYDTHYDAGNLELSWWQGKTRHRIDFQPQHEEPLRVTSLQDTYPFLPKLLFWCRKYVPMFPILPRVEWKTLGTLQEPYLRSDIEALVQNSLPPNNSFKPTPLRGVGKGS